MKIGIMGGTFDPVHIGHLLLGEFAYEEFGLDEIWFMPNGNPPHKKTEYTEEALHHRIEMVKLAVSDVPYFKVCLYEAETEEHSYTYSLFHLRGGLAVCHRRMEKFPGNLPHMHDPGCHAR